MGNEMKMNWEGDFKEFINSDSLPLPAAVSESVLVAVSADLHPSPWWVFAKLGVIQAGAGLSSLLFCPQFGLSFTSSRGLMPYLMNYGMGVCMLGCGALFASLSFLIAALMLRPEEVRTIRSNRFLQITSLTALSLGAFICSGAAIVASFGFLWAIGAVAGGLATLELGWSVRRWRYQRSTS
jgi:hypothetical protein